MNPLVVINCIIIKRRIKAILSASLSVFPDFSPRALAIILQAVALYFFKILRILSQVPLQVSHIPTS